MGLPVDINRHRSPAPGPSALASATLMETPWTASLPERRPAPGSSTRAVGPVRPSPTGRATRRSSHPEGDLFNPAQPAAFQSATAHGCLSSAVFAIMPATEVDRSRHNPDRQPAPGQDPESRAYDCSRSFAFTLGRRLTARNEPAKHVELAGPLARTSPSGTIPAGGLPRIIMSHLHDTRAILGVAASTRRHGRWGRTAASGHDRPLPMRAGVLRPRPGGTEGFRTMRLGQAGADR